MEANFYGWFLGELNIKVSKIGYGCTKLEVTMFSKYTAQISSNEIHFLTVGLLVY